MATHLIIPRKGSLKDIKPNRSRVEDRQRRMRPIRPDNEQGKDLVGEELENRLVRGVRVAVEVVGCISTGWMSYMERRRESKTRTLRSDSELKSKVEIPSRLRKRLSDGLSLLRIESLASVVLVLCKKVNNRSYSANKQAYRVSVLVEISAVKLEVRTVGRVDSLNACGNEKDQ